MLAQCTRHDRNHKFLDNTLHSSQSVSLCACFILLAILLVFSDKSTICLVFFIELSMNTSTINISDFQCYSICSNFISRLLFHLLTWFRNTIGFERARRRECAPSPIIRWTFIAFIILIYEPNGTKQRTQMKIEKLFGPNKTLFDTSTVSVPGGEQFI